MSRNDDFFTPRWIEYYGLHLGRQNLYLVLDGLDQPLPEGHEKINVIRIPHLEMKRAEGDRKRAEKVSSLARELFLRYDIIIAHDIDEILVIDPGRGQTFQEYFGRPFGSAAISALGLDVGQHLDEEDAIDAGRPFLEQRGFAHVSARYTKAVVATKPVRWGSGFHRVKGRNFHIDPNLYLFHFGMVDYAISKKKIEDNSLIKSGWKGHFGRRLELFDIIRNSPPMDGDDFFSKARLRQTLLRPLWALNKPGMLREKPVIRIPDRFRTIV